MEKMIYIILVNYNGCKDTLDCIDSLRFLNYENYKVIIVDNASTDDSYEVLKANVKEDIILIKSEKNLGFAGGNNIGIDYALKEGAEGVLLLNNDTLVEPDFLSKMVENLKEEKVGLVAPKIKYEGKRDYLWFAGGEILWDKFYAIHYGEGERDSEKYNKRKELSFITGCSMLISRSLLEDIGGLSEDYFMYFEDVDYCVRAKDAGFKIIYEPEATIYHKVSASTGGEESPFAVQWNTRNRIIFMEKYKNKVSKATLYKGKVFFYTTRIIKYLQYLLKGRKDKAKSLLKGIKEGRKYNRNYNC
ncbi:glycosyltransferase family 2 protein [Clostridium sp. MSJ-4]|uniref:Glycosyltransferase family 2 protein n=1 Tax=Clostridium simiarum TaxID=2841506 RepID=A0ABS6F2K3_9CLOT|nr:glycosyltransferase family 2 protein [Clostridium simiarum]MBU5592488.1 glycosyltransferase family 2 protein [Clostridium simiarum]